MWCVLSGSIVVDVPARATAGLLRPKGKQVKIPAPSRTCECVGDEKETANTMRGSG